MSTRDNNSGSRKDSTLSTGRRRTAAAAPAKATGDEDRSRRQPSEMTERTEQLRIELERDRLALEREKIALEREKIALEREKVQLERARLEIDMEQLRLRRESQGNGVDQDNEDDDDEVDLDDDYGEADHDEDEDVNEDDKIRAVKPAAQKPEGKDPGPVVFVKTLTGKTLTIQFDPSDEVTLLRKRVEEAEGCPRDQRRLIYGGRALEDGRTLRDYGIQRGSTLYLALRLGGC